MQVCNEGSRIAEYLTSKKPHAVRVFVSFLEFINQYMTFLVIFRGNVNQLQAGCSSLN